MFYFVLHMCAYENVGMTFRSCLLDVSLLKFSRTANLRLFRGRPHASHLLCLVCSAVTHTAFPPGSLFLLSTAAVISAANPPRWQPQAIGGILVRGGANAREDGPYSFSLTTFSPRGSLTQIEYAINSAQVRVSYHIRSETRDETNVCSQHV